MLKAIYLILLCGCAHSPPTVLFKGESKIDREPRHVLGSAHAQSFDRSQWEWGHANHSGMTNVSVIQLEDWLRKAEFVEQLTHPLPETPPMPPK